MNIGMIGRSEGIGVGGCQKWSGSRSVESRLEISQTVPLPMHIATEMLRDFLLSQATVCARETQLVSGVFNGSHLPASKNSTLLFHNRPHRVLIGETPTPSPP